MLVTVNLTGLLQMQLDTSRVQMHFCCGSQPSVWQVIDRLVARRSDAAAPGSYPGEKGGSLDEYLIFLRRNGTSRSIAKIDGRDTCLRDGDELTFVYRFSGG